VSNRPAIDAESAIGREVRGLLCQCVIERDELHMFKCSDRLCRQAPADWVTPGSADRRCNLRQHEVGHDDVDLLLVERCQEFPANGVKRVGRIGIPGEYVGVERIHYSRILPSRRSARC
jgi:hypothetical protein